MDEKTLTYIQDNVPEATAMAIEFAFAKNNGDILETITELLKVPKKEEKPKTAWETRREICDEHDTNAQQVLKERATPQIQE